MNSRECAHDFFGKPLRVLVVRYRGDRHTGPQQHVGAGRIGSCRLGAQLPLVLGIVSTYVPAQRLVANVILLAVIFGLTAIVTVSLWAGFGSSLRRALGNPRTALYANRAMGLTLALTVLPILVG